MISNKLHAYKLNLSIILLFYSFALFASEIKQDSIRLSLMKRFDIAKKIRYQNPDSSIVLLEEVHGEFIKIKDTTQAIKVLLDIADIYSHQAKYAKSYEILWQSLFLADDINDDAVDAVIYLKIGRLYGFYRRKSEAIKHLKNSLEINKKLVKERIMDKANLVHNYYALCCTYREFNRPKIVEKYLDSCYSHYAKIPNQIDEIALSFVKAYVLGENNQNKEALELLKEIEPKYLQESPSFLVPVYDYWGDIYHKQGNIDESLNYYLKALKISKTYFSHIDFEPILYYKLSKIHLKLGHYAKAFQYQETANNLDIKYFDSRSENNRPLLEIKDEFLLQKEQHKNLIQKQRLEQLEQEDKILLLQRVILSITILFLIVIGIIYFKQLRTRHLAEKELIKRNKELEIKMAKELLDVKNKELATSALQLIEKDIFLKDLKMKMKNISGNAQVLEIKKTLRSMSINNNNNWEDFKLRFTSINESFYKQLTDKYSNLSQNELKLCALIKLNFSSKDISKLLGITVESVHSNRYILRKKMNLSRKVNLEDYIGSL
ncbi:tetratricopeptide repeat protein [Flavivirga rizhaonensis]|uniref:Tetratricopeptide repeat protein n=1 Tax=Flavivirga rizhaonensis TaxID=2559571 RepID=A0A4V3P598_9FLAO|nr:tetratricopeptide repeat protein [Flavivirga rizhaonensis]TGV04374.1 tetratricopeptide repeat protein [Flavivirga rizhaonensis]